MEQVVQLYRCLHAGFPDTQETAASVKNMRCRVVEPQTYTHVCEWNSLLCLHKAGERQKDRVR